MVKKKYEKKYEKKEDSKESKEEMNDAKEESKEEAMSKEEREFEAKLPKEAREKLKKIKAKIDKFQKKVVEKFENYVMGISLLPPEKPEEGKKVDKDKINVFVLIDDRDSKKMTKQELKDKLSAIIADMAKEVDPDLSVETMILSELWQNCYDGNHQVLQMIALGAPVYDKGMISAIKISEIHKTMVLKKFEKYIVSYVLMGSLVRGEATHESDIDVWIIIDDTDVKKMSRFELKDKLRAIIAGMAIEAGDITGIKNKLSCQVHILTDVWDSLKEANPIVFTFLRDGIPLYDKGIFMPWKQLLQMGKIKPSPEAIDMFMTSGAEMLKRVEFKLKDIGMEDIFLAILTPSQAALMLYGLAPGTRRETPRVMRDVFVKKEHIFEEEYVKILEEAVELHKSIEYGTKKEVTGTEIDDLLDKSKRYLDRIKKLFAQIEEKKEQEDIHGIHDTALTIVRDLLKGEGVKLGEDCDVRQCFKSVISKGVVPERFLKSFDEITNANKLLDEGKITKSEIDKVKKDAGVFMRSMVEYIQRKRGRELERTKIRVKHGSKFGEVLLLGDTAFIIMDIDAEEKEVSKANINPDGSLGTTQKSSFEDLESHLSKISVPEKAFIKQPIFDDLKRLFGKDVEILVNY